MNLDGYKYLLTKTSFHTSAWKQVGVAFDGSPIKRCVPWSDAVWDDEYGPISPIAYSVKNGPCPRCNPR